MNRYILALLLVFGAFVRTPSCGKAAPEEEAVPLEAADMSQTVLPGLFSVSPERQVRFSKGNLQATYSKKAGKYRWGFAAHQYDFVGGNNGQTAGISGNNNIDRQTDGAKVDLFGWTVDGKYADGIKQYGINTSIDNADYGPGGECCDWGAVIDDKVPWRVLSSEEWNYLVNLRKIKRGGVEDEFSGMGHTCQRVRYHQVSGLIVYPDEYEGTVFDHEASIADDDFPDDCVFLPTAGYRFGSGVFRTDNWGKYWSGTPARPDCAYYFFFDLNRTFVEYYYGCDGYSVRLVTDSIPSNITL